MGTQLVLGFAKRYFFNLCNALNPKPNLQTIRILSSYCNISLFSLVFILEDEDELTKIYERNYIISLAYKVGQRDACYEDFNCLVNGETLKTIDAKTIKKITDAWNKLKNNHPETHIDKIQCYPDFVFHESNNPNSTDSEYQHLILEAKTTKSLSLKDFCKDFFKLNLYIEKLNFRNAVYLLINTQMSTVEKFINEYIKEYGFISNANGKIYFLIQENLESDIKLYSFEKEIKAEANLNK